MRDIVLNKFISIEEKNGEIKNVKFLNENNFNFAYHIIDELAKREPDQLAMIYVSQDYEEKRITYKDLMTHSNQIANYMKSVGINRGDTVIIALKRAYQFWYLFLALNKIGAIPVPVVSQLRKKDIEQRIDLCNAKAIICINNDDFQYEVEKMQKQFPNKRFLKFSVRGNKYDWLDLEKEAYKYSTVFNMEEKYPCGKNTMFMLFTSGTSGNLKLVSHDYRYPLIHYITALFWNKIEAGKIHLTISDSGWGKALWGKLFGPWLVGGIVFVFDYEKFDVVEILSVIEKYKVNTICMPPTMYRMLLDKNISMKKYFNSVSHVCAAGEMLPKTLIHEFYSNTGKKIVNGYGQTETGLLIANFNNNFKEGSIGKPNPVYTIKLLKDNGQLASIGEIGEIVVDCSDTIPVGMTTSIQDKNQKSLSIIDNDGYYHTGDLASIDINGEYWYKGRNDSIIKSSGYRISPYEIESVIENLSYVKECKVYGIPDSLRGVILKAEIILKERNDEEERIKKDIQNYVKEKTAPYKYPRVIEFVDTIEKTISGKKIRG